jgi:hypothetical protein
MNTTMNRIFRRTLVAVTLAAAGAASANITFYTRENFGGQQMTVDRTVPNFADTRFNDRAQSVIVNEGQWEVCVDSDFRGACQVLGPGRYPDLAPWGARSVRCARRRCRAGVIIGAAGGLRQRATLYEGPNLSGRAFPLNGGFMDNLDGTGFNDRASSLRVESGYGSSAAMRIRRRMPDPARRLCAAAAWSQRPIVGSTDLERVSVQPESELGALSGCAAAPQRGAHPPREAIAVEFLRHIHAVPEFPRQDALLLPFAVARILSVRDVPQRDVVLEIRVGQREVLGVEQPVVDDAHALGQWETSRALT